MLVIITMPIMIVRFWTGHQLKLVMTFCLAYTSNHLFDAKEQQLGGCIAKPIKIGNHCWLGGNVSVTPGTTIGDNTIIGAGSVVTHDIPANVIAVGAPAKVIRKITENDQTRFDPDNPNYL